MATSRGQELHGILNSLELGNKQDCYDFSSGHLNENKLLKISEKQLHQQWLSSQQPKISLTPRSHLTRTDKNVKQGLLMKDALLKFSVGTNAAFPAPPKSERPAKVRSSRKERSAERGESYVSDGILIEEFHPDDTQGLKSPSQEAVIPSIRDVAVTKRDVYQKRQIYETNVIKKQDARETNVMSGLKAVEHLETRLKLGLDLLQYPGNGPSFHRLQVFNSVFDDLIKESNILGPILKTIKSEYDAFLSYLLDNNPEQHHLLHDQIQQLTNRRITAGNYLCQQQVKLSSLEREAEDLLAENKRLRDEIYLENNVENEPTPARKVVEHRSSAHRKGIADTIECLRSQILSKLDSVQKFRTDLRENYTPVSVVTQQEECLRELEVENQRLSRKNELHAEKISQLIELLESEIKMADTSERDAARVWRRLLPKSDGSASKSKWSDSRTSLASLKIELERSGSEFTSDTSDSESDDEKWSWYIS